MTGCVWLLQGRELADETLWWPSVRQLTIKISINYAIAVRFSWLCWNEKKNRNLSSFVLEF